MTPCEHADRLWARGYPGRFCIYCDAEIAEINAEDGQVVLTTGRGKRYVAALHQAQQRIVEQIDMTAPYVRFKDDDQEVAFETSGLIASFQQPDETWPVRVRAVRGESDA
jgi:hypothetical protein